MSESSEQRQLACPLWVWLVLIAGLVVLFLIYYQATTKKALLIQEDIQNRTVQNLHTIEQLNNVVANADGRDITLSGEVDTKEALLQAEKIAQQTYGVRLINNQIKVSEAVLSAPAEKKTESTNLPAVMKLNAKVEPMPDEFAPLEDEALNHLADTVHEEQTLQTQTEIAAGKLSQLDFSNITFEKNSSALTANAKTTLDVAVATLIENSAVDIRIEGHTDTSGNSDLNLNLSKQRAQSVMNYLVDAGIKISRIEADGYGDQFPIAPNDTEAGRIKNRRIEIKVTNGE